MMLKASLKSLHLRLVFLPKVCPRPAFYAQRFGSTPMSLQELPAYLKHGNWLKSP
jgi:hypothetical protein